MLAFVVRRAVLGVIVLWALSIASFYALFSRERLQVYSPLRGHSLLPLYWTWLKGVFTGRTFDLIFTPAASQLNPSARTTFVDSIGHTAVLLSVTLVLVLLFAVGLALVAASRRGSGADIGVRGISYLAWAVPPFLLALLVQKLLYTFGGDHGVGPFPIAGWPGSCPIGLGLDAGSLQNCPAAGSGLTYVGNLFRYITLPAATLALGFIGLHGRYLRSALLETLQAPFVRTAEAKGLPQRWVVLRHALRASLPTFLSAVLSDFGAIFGAAMAVDFMFGLNGLGTVLVSDFPGPNSDSGFVDTNSVQMVIVIAGAVVLLASFLAELSVVWLDPRMREAE